MDAEKGEPSYTAGGNANWGNHSRKQYGNINIGREMCVHICWSYKDILECFLSKYSKKRKSVYF